MVKEWGNPLFYLCGRQRRGEGGAFMAKGKRAPGGAGGTVAVCARLAQPVAEELGLVLWDVRFVKEGAAWYLRYIIDKEEGVSIDDCVEMSRRLNPILDEADPIPQAYCMEVSSPGLNRELVKPAHFAAFEGWPVTVKLYQPVDGSRELTGRLLGRTEEGLRVETSAGVQVFGPKDYAAVHLIDDEEWDDPEDGDQA